ncbi:ATP-binding protein [Mucilaginibacter sp. AW1-3]
MDLLNDPLFQALFNTDVPRIVLKTNAPDFTILTYNDAFKAATYTQQRDVKGKSLWEAYDPQYANGDSGVLLRNTLTNAIHTRQVVNLPPFQYDILSADQRSMETSWWELEIIPVGTVDDRAEYLLITTHNITDKILTRRKIDDGLLREQNLAEELEATNEELSAANEELTSTVEELKQSESNLRELNEKLEDRVILRTNQLFASTYRTEQQRDKLASVINNIPLGICILSGKNMVVEMANKTLLAMWHRDDMVIGKPIIEIFPELKRQEFPKILDHVFTTGMMHSSSEARVEYIIDGVLTTSYRDYSYTALRNIDGEIDSILAVAVDVTERALSQKREQQLTEELAASNEELLAINEELRAANEEQLRWQNELEDLNKKIRASENTLKQAIATANLGTWSADLATDALTISERTRAIHEIPSNINLTLTEAMQLITPDYRDLLKNAIQEAISQGSSFETEYMINPMDNGKPRWLRSTGKAEYDEAGNPININGTILDITEVKADEQRKNDFIGMVSHELKTPLTSLKAYAQMLNLKAKKDNDAFAANSLNKIEIQINKMATMINGFLNLSRLESSKIYLNKQPFDLCELVDEIISETLLVTSSHTINLQHANQPVMVNADRDKIGHVISNLLSNAVKYSPRGKSIDVKCEATADVVEVSVKDDGMGIKPKDIERLFERYYRVETKDTENISGFGIGLYLSAEIVKRHDGKIWVESESGIGSTFKFTLPLYQ